MSHLNTAAYVRLTIEIPVGAWGDDCTLDQVYRQAEREARERVTALLAGNAKIVGVIEIEAVSTKRKP